MKKNQWLKTFYPDLDELYRKIDKQHIRRTQNIRLIPNFEYRRGGKLSYAEWAHVIGIFQTLIYNSIDEKAGNDIIDIGCGTGLLGISSEPYVKEGGSYTGIDIQKKDIDFCQKHYKALDNYNFIHMDAYNPMYAKEQNIKKAQWPIKDNSKDLLTALSVWTHLNEEDSIFYMKEVARVIKDSGRAIVTFFYLDETYRKTLQIRDKGKGRYHSLNQERFVFSDSAYGSKHWFAPSWCEQPEDVIGLTESGMDILLKESGLKIVEHHPGNWKEIAALYFQDIFVLEKA